MSHSDEVKSKFQIITQLRHDGGQDAVRGLIQYAADENSRVRGMAILKLGGLQAEEAVDIIIRHLHHDESTDVRAVSAHSIGFYDSGVGYNDLIQALTDRSDCVTMSAMSALAARKHIKAIPTLKRFLNHSSWDIRFFTCESLMQLGYASSQVIETLESFKNSPEGIEHDQGIHASRQLIEGLIDSGELKIDEETVESDVMKTIDEVLTEARKMILSAD